MHDILFPTFAKNEQVSLYYKNNFYGINTFYRSSSFNGTAIFDKTSAQIKISAGGTGNLTITYDGIHGLDFAGAGAQGYTFDGPLIPTYLSVSQGIMTTGTQINVIIGSATGASAVNNNGGGQDQLPIGANTWARLELGHGGLSGATTTLTGNYNFATILTGGKNASISLSSSGTHSLVTCVAIKQNQYVSGGALVTNAASLYIQGPAEISGSAGSSSLSTISGSYSLWVDSGSSRLDGDLNLQAITHTPTTPASGINLFADSLNLFSWKSTNGLLTKFDPSANTADRTYTLQDRAGTVALEEISIRSITASAYTLVITDAGEMVAMSGSGANTVTVPPNSSVAFNTGTSISVIQDSTGQTQIITGSGVIILAADGGSKTRTIYSTATLVKKATDTWYLFGDITP